MNLAHPPVVGDVAFWVFAVGAVVSGWRVFETDSMVRATFLLLTSFLNVGAILLLLGGAYLGVALLFMMTVEMTVMAIFMVAFMMNPAGLNPMNMVHQPRVAAAVGWLVFAVGVVVAARRRLPGSSAPSGAPGDRGARHRVDGPFDARVRDRRCRRSSRPWSGRDPVEPAQSLRRRRRRRRIVAAFARAGRAGVPGRGPARSPRRRRRPPSHGARVSLPAVLIVAAALVGLGIWGALAQQSIVMLLMGIELMVNGVMLAAAGFWAYAAGGTPKGQLLVVVALVVMAVEMAVGFAIVVALYRARQIDMTDDLDSMSH